MKTNAHYSFQISISPHALLTVLSQTTKELFLKNTQHTQHSSPTTLAVHLKKPEYFLTNSCRLHWRPQRHHSLYVHKAGTWGKLRRLYQQALMEMILNLVSISVIF